MGFDTKPNLSNAKFEQLTGETLTLNGLTEVHGTLEIENGGVFRVDDGNQQNGYVLTSDASGNASWSINPDIYVSGATLSGTTLELKRTEGESDVTVDLSSLSTSAGGGDTHVQFNNNGEFSGTSNFTWVESSRTLNVVGDFAISGTSFLRAGSDITQIELGQNASSNGANGVAIGTNSNTTNIRAVAIGIDSISTGINSIAIGYGAQGCITNGVAIGRGTLASGNRATVLGHQSIGSGDCATVLGGLAEGIGNFSVTVGSNACSIGNNSTSIGFDAFSNTSSVALGSDATASVSNTIAIGRNAQATSLGAISIGTNAVANNTRGIAIGCQASTLGFDSISMGYQSCSNLRSISIGCATQSTCNAVVIGNTSYGANSSTSIGRSTCSIINGVSIGAYSQACGAGSIAIGRDAVVTGSCATAIGFTSEAFGERSISIGLNTDSTENDAIGIGYCARACGTKSLGIGSFTIASNTKSMIVGSGDGNASRVENEIDNSLAIAFGNHSFTNNNSNLYPNLTIIGVEGETTNTTPLVIKTLTLEDAVAASVEVFITTSQSPSGATRGYFVRRGLIYRDSGGNATIQGTIEDVATIESNSGLDVTVTVSGNDINFNVIGIASVNMHWLGYIKLTKVR